MTAVHLAPWLIPALLAGVILWQRSKARMRRRVKAAKFAQYDAISRMLK